MDAQDQLLKLTSDMVRRARLDGMFDMLVARSAVETYGVMAKPLGLFAGAGEFAKLLGQTQVEDRDHERPLRSALCVGEERGIPGAGFFGHARMIGYKIGSSPQDEFTFWLEQLTKLGVKPDGRAVKYAATLGIVL